MAVEIIESATEGTVVATLSTVGGTAPFTYDITAQERANWFQIDGDELQVGTGDIDYETDASPSVTIEVTDAHGYTFSKTFSIPVLNDPDDDDVTPDAFTFTDITSATLSTVYTSNTITVAGLGPTASVAVTISGGTYSKNGGGYTSSPGTAVNGDTFAVRLTSSGSNSTAANATLTIGGVSDTYTVTTAAAILFTTWSNTLKHANITTDGYTVTRSGADAFKAVKSVQTFTTGKIKWEVTVNNMGGNTGSIIVGLIRADQTSSFDYPGANSLGVGFQSNNFYYNSGGLWVNVNPGTIAASNVIVCEVDRVAETFKVAVDTGSFVSAGMPAGMADGQTLHIMIGQYTATTSTTTNFGDSPWVKPPTSGFTGLLA